jgi:hypothetical protein
MFRWRPLPSSGKATPQTEKHRCLRYLSCHVHIAIFRVSPSTQLFMSHLPRMYLAGWIVKFPTLEITPELTSSNRSQSSTSYSLWKTIATHRKRPSMQFMQEKMGCDTADFFQVCHHAIKTFIQNCEMYPTCTCEKFSYCFKEETQFCRYFYHKPTLCNSGEPRNFIRGGFNKFIWGQRTEITGIWGR